MNTYLAEKYMSGPKADAILSRAGPKKKKRKTQTSEMATSSMLIDDDGGWGDEKKDDGDDIAEAVVEKDRSFKKRRLAPAAEGSGWATIQEGVKAETPPPDDEKPLIVEDQSQAPFVGGLITSSQLKKTLASTKPKTAEVTKEEMEAAQETVYRDVAGRKIDTKAERAEAARRKREREEKEAQKMEWGKGLVQKDEKARLKEEMERNRHKGFSRRVDDQDLNEDLKAQDRWNDPAAAFLTKKKSKGPRKPEYAGPPPPPNRFGIKPGYRWDGVDRGNGFEKKLFQHSNDKRRRGQESYQWSVDDM